MQVDTNFNFATHLRFLLRRDLTRREPGRRTRTSLMRTANALGWADAVAERRLGRWFVSAVRSSHGAWRQVTEAPSLLCALRAAGFLPDS